MKLHSLLIIYPTLLSFIAMPSAIAQSSFPSPNQVQRIRQQFPKPNTEIEESKIKQTPDFSIPKIEWIENTEGLETLAMQDFNSGKYKKAAVRFAQLTWISPNVARYHHMRGKANLRGNNPVGAMVAFSNAIELEPNNPDLFCQRGISHKDVKMGGAALQDFNRAISLDLNHFHAYFHRGDLFRLAGDYEKAIDDFSKAIALKPKLAHTYYHRGIVFASMKQRNKAILDISQAATLFEQQNQTEEHQFVVDVLERLKVYDDASE